MPSPFPGMDPYLEGSEWGTFHIELSVEIRRQLSPKVRPKYHVLTMRRSIPVPLLTGDENVWLDLQLAFGTVYDSVGYRDLLDHRQSPEIPLAEEAAGWATSILNAADFAV